MEYELLSHSSNDEQSQGQRQGFKTLLHPLQYEVSSPILLCRYALEHN